MDVLLTFIVIAITLKWGGWRNWKLYYPTIVFWALGNFIYLYLTIDKPLWKFSNTILPIPLAEVMMSCVMFPCFALLFLPYFPEKGVVKKTLYIGLWTVIFSVIEWRAVSLGEFTYKNGWNLSYSVIFNIVMFTLLRIHFKDPRWAWIISIFLAVATFTFFKIPFSDK